MRPAFAVRHRPRWPGNGILRLRILRVRTDTVWARGFATGRARRRHASGVLSAAAHRSHDATLTRSAIASQWERSRSRETEDDRPSCRRTGSILSRVRWLGVIARRTRHALLTLISVRPREIPVMADVLLLAPLGVGTATAAVTLPAEEHHVHRRGTSLDVHGETRRPAGRPSVVCETPEEGLEPPTRRLTAVCSTS